MDIHPPHAIHSWKDFGIQLVTITAGILNALSLEGVRESIHNRALVREARENIHHEIVDNARELDHAITLMPTREKKLEQALGRSRSAEVRGALHVSGIPGPAAAARARSDVGDDRHPERER